MLQLSPTYWHDFACPQVSLTSNNVTTHGIQRNMTQKSKQQGKHTVGFITNRCIRYCKKKQPLCTNNRKDITLALLPDMLCATASSPYPNTTILQREITHLRPEQYRLKKNHCFSINRCLLSLFLRSLLLSALVFLGCCLSSAGLFSVARIGLRERSEDDMMESNFAVALGRLAGDWWALKAEGGHGTRGVR